MRAALLLLAHSLKRVRILLGAMGLLLCGFQMILILVARAVQRTNSFEELTRLLPPFFREMLGPALTSFMSFSGLVCLGYFHLAVIGALIVDPCFVTSLHKFASIQRDGLLVEADAPVEIAFPPGCFAVSNQTVDLFSVDRVREFRA